MPKSHDTDFDSIAAQFGDDPGDSGAEQGFSCTASIWLWRAANPEVPAAWHFITLDAEVSAQIKRASLGRTGGFGSVKVTAQIGGTAWKTSLFPSKEAGGYMLPVKASVRKAERLKAGDDVEVSVTF
jgi:hypothetical protein